MIWSRNNLALKKTLKIIFKVFYFNFKNLEIRIKTARLNKLNQRKQPELGFDTINPNYDQPIKKQINQIR